MHRLTEHPDYSQALDICRALQGKGYTAWLAGGCVRDGILGRSPKDLDIVTNAEPDQVESLFEKTIAVGKQFGIIVVVLGDKRFDVATFRSDGAYVDGRHPTSVHYSTPNEDAERRDFTINAMYFDPVTGQIFDFVSGQQDLVKKVIRTVGDPTARFKEDKLRILRAIRFVSELGFQIEGETYDSICKLTDQIHLVSAERQWIEIKKLLNGQHRSAAWKLLEDSKLFHQLFPELQSGVDHSTSRLRYFDKSNGVHSGLALLAGLFFMNERSPIARAGEAGDRIKKLESCIRRFKGSGEELEISKQILVALEMISQTQRLAYLKKLAAKPFAADLIEIAEGLMLYGFLFPGLKTVLQEKGHVLPAPLVSAETLFKNGLAAGPRFGRVIEEAYNLQLENPQLGPNDLVQKALKVSDNQ